VKGGDLAYAVPFQLFMDYSSIGWGYGVFNGYIGWWVVAWAY
jgi:hypothetical protein